MQHLEDFGAMTRYQRAEHLLIGHQLIDQRSAEVGNATLAALTELHDAEHDLCPLCRGEHDRISRQDWDGCGGGCGPCPEYPR